MRIEQVDPEDEHAFAAWFAVVDAVQRDERPNDPGWTLHEQRELARIGARPDADEQIVLLQAVDGDGVVGVARLDLPLTDNQHLCEVVLLTHPERRRRGAARVLLDEVERRAKAAGRTTLTAVSEEPPGTEGRSPSRGFGRATGFQAEQVEIRRDIDLPLGDAVVSGLAAVAAEHAADYDVRTWRDAVPEDLLEDQAYLFRRMSTDVPKGDMDWQEEQWDAARVRREEAHVQAMGRSFFGAGAVHRPSGRMVAYTTMGIARAQPERVHQWDTLVLSEHRGHRLGMLVKLACLQRIADDLPQARYITTWNAQENIPMIAVNDALGARTSGQLINWQKRL